MGVGNLATNVGNQEKIMNEGALQPLLSLARRDNGDLESQRYAVFALTNVTATRSNHARLIGAGVCELVAELLEADDVEIRNSAAFCVGNFASNPDNHATLLDEGVLGPLIVLVASSDPQVRFLLAITFAFVRCCSRCRSNGNTNCLCFAIGGLHSDLFTAAVVAATAAAHATLSFCVVLSICQFSYCLFDCYYCLCHYHVRLPPSNLPCATNAT